MRSAAQKEQQQLMLLPFHSLLLLLLLLLASANGLATIGGHAVTKRVARTRHPDGAIQSTLFAYSTNLGVKPDSTALRHDVLAAQVWPASRALALEMGDILREVEALYLDKAKPFRFCELGAGSGLAGLSAAAAANAAAPPEWDILVTDVDALSPHLIKAAAKEQGLSDLVSTGYVDLLSSPHEAPLPAADLYVMADVFVSEAVAAGAARRCAEALAAGGCVLVAAQEERSCRGQFLESLRALLLGTTEEQQGPAGEETATAVLARTEGRDGRPATFEASREVRMALEVGWAPSTRTWPLCLLDVDEEAVCFG